MLRPVAGKMLGGSKDVQELLVKLHFKLNQLVHSSDGQDMVEYALVVGILCFGVTSASQFLSASLARTFANISTNVGSYVN
jgi:Flp pilus assembly pilin Flp